MISTAYERIKDSHLTLRSCLTKQPFAVVFFLRKWPKHSATERLSDAKGGKPEAVQGKEASWCMVSNKPVCVWCPTTLYFGDLIKIVSRWVAHRTRSNCQNYYLIHYGMSTSWPSILGESMVCQNVQNITMFVNTFTYSLQICTSYLWKRNILIILDILAMLTHSKIALWLHARQLSRFW